MPDTTVHAILAAVESLEPNATGAFVVELAGESVGYVFVENNRVCWAAAWRLRRRLREILREQHAPTTSRDAAMRDAIERHTIESLLAFPQAQGERISFQPHANGLRPRFTFSPVDVLVAVNAFLYASESKGSDVALSILDPDVPGASFVTGDDGSPIAVRTCAWRGRIVDLDALGDWASAAFGVTRGFTPEVMRRIASGTGAVTLAWRTSKSFIHAAVLERGANLDRLVANVESRGYPAVLSNHVARVSQPVNWSPQYG